MDCSLAGCSVPWDFPGKNPGVGFHFLLQRIFPTQGQNPHLLRWQADSLPLSYQGSPCDSTQDDKDETKQPKDPISAKIYHGLQPTRQAPLSMGFSRQEYWSELPLPSLPHSLEVLI